jgi:tryptophan synthase beta chain
MKLAKEMDKDQVIVVHLSGRGDKHIRTVAQIDGINI